MVKNTLLLKLYTFYLNIIKIYSEFYDNLKDSFMFFLKNRDNINYNIINDKIDIYLITNIIYK